MALASSESSTIPPVIITFVRASPNSITLDFSLGAAPKLRSGAQPTPLQVACYELQWRLVAEPGERIGPSQDSPWEVASSTLKNSRCTKGGLAAGAAYAFRARCCNTGQFWGALGPETAPLRTLLPELPADCSESLKVPSKVLAAQAEKEAERAQLEAAERTARDSAAHAERVQHEHAMQRVRKAESAALAYEHTAARIITQAIEQCGAHAQRSLYERAEKRVGTVRFELQEEVGATPLMASDWPLVASDGL